MAHRIIGTTPRQDGYRMPAEFEKQDGEIQVPDDVKKES